MQSTLPGFLPASAGSAGHPATGSFASPQKPKYVIFNHLERAGIEARQKELAAKYERSGDPKAKIDWLKLHLAEVRSCFQSVKNELEQSRHLEAQRQQEIAEKDQRIAALHRELDETKEKKKRCDDDLGTFSKLYQAKKAKLEETETANKRLVKVLEEQDARHLKAMEDAASAFYNTHQKQVEQFRQEITSLRQQLNDEKQHYGNLASEYSKYFGETNRLREQYQQLMELKDSLEAQVAEKAQTNDFLGRQIAQLEEMLHQAKATIEERESTILKLNFQITDHGRFIQQIEHLIQQRKQEAYVHGVVDKKD